MEVRDKLKEIYDLVQDRGLYISPEQDMKFGAKESFSLNKNDSEKLTISSESYNSTLLWTLLTGIRRRGAMIYFGPPGAGKTTLAEIVGHFIYGQPIEEIQNATIYGHPEQTESSMIARLHTGKLVQGVEEIISREFLNSNVKIIDEVNRLPPGKLSILYQLVDRGFVKYLSERIVAKEGPVYATANAPDSGNYPLPLPFLDRFDVAVVANELNPFFLDALMEKGDGNSKQSSKNFLKKLELPDKLKISSEELEKARTDIERVSIGTDAFYLLVSFISEINYCNEAGVDLEHKTKAFALNRKPGDGLCSKCHYIKNVCSMTSNDLSPRTFSGIIAYSRSLAWYRGRDAVGLDDLEAAIPFLVWHKLIPTRVAFDENSVFENDRIGFVGHLLDKVKQDFTKSKGVFKSYDSLLDAIGKVMEGKPDLLASKAVTRLLKENIEGLKDVDSVLKFPLAVTLSQVYKRMKT